MRLCDGSGACAWCRAGPDQVGRQGRTYNKSLILSAIVLLLFRSHCWSRLLAVKHQAEPGSFEDEGNK